MATTTNYGWTTPDDTALVKDGASAIRSLGSSVDTTVKNLNPETTLGDISYRSSTANTNTRLAIGTTGQVLTVSGGVPTWAAPAGGGKILQVVQGTLTSNVTSTNTAYTDIGLSVSITPSSSSSKVMVFVSMPATFIFNTVNNAACIGYWNLVRGTTQLQEYIHGTEANSIINRILYGGVSMSYLDSPATTSATTYKCQMKPAGSNTGDDIRVFASATKIASIVAFEVGA